MKSKKEILTEFYDFIPENNRYGENEVDQHLINSLVALCRDEKTYEILQGKNFTNLLETKENFINYIINKLSEEFGPMHHEKISKIKLAAKKKIGY